MKYKRLVLVLGIFLFSGCAQMTGNVSTTVHVKRTEVNGTETIIDYESYGDKQNIEGLKVDNLFGANVEVDSRVQEGNLNAELVRALLEQTEKLIEIAP